MTKIKPGDKVEIVMGEDDLLICPICRHPNIIVRNWLKEPDIWCGFCNAIYEKIKGGFRYLGKQVTQ